MSEEHELIQRASRGDKEAYRKLVEAYQDRLFGLVLSMVHKREEAEDLIQEIFVKAYFALPTFAGQSAFYTWLYRIASNRCLDHLRKHRLDTVSLDAPIDATGETSFGDMMEAPASDNPTVGAESRDQSQTVLQRLDPEQRLILTLRELEGYSYEEIAEILNCPVNTVKSRLNRSREALKSAYVRLFGNIPDDKIVSKIGEKS